MKKNKIKTNIALLGGDSRELVLLEALAQNSAWQINVFALPEQVKKHSNIKYYDNAKGAISESDIVILPLAGIHEDGSLPASLIKDKVFIKKEDLLDLDAKTIIIAGIASDYLKNLAKKLDLELLLTAKNPEIAIPNAVPTAEAAVCIAMQELDITIAESRALIFGLGNLGKAIGSRLIPWGVDVIAFDNNPDLYINRDKTRCFPVEEGEKYLKNIDVIFNTVNTLVLDANLLEKMSPNTLIVDLASKPGGTDFKKAKELGIKAIHALGLPGKYAPITAGNILANYYPRLIENTLNASGR